MVVDARTLPELAITNARIRAYDVRLQKLLTARRVGVLKIQLICAHQRVAVSDSPGEQAMRMCLSCGLSEVGPDFVVLTHTPALLATGTAILKSRAGLCISGPDKLALAAGKATLYALAFEFNRRHIFHDGL